MTTAERATCAACGLPRATEEENTAGPPCGCHGRVSCEACDALCWAYDTRDCIDTMGGPLAAVERWRTRAEAAETAIDKIAQDFADIADKPEDLRQLCRMAGVLSAVFTPIDDGRGPNFSTVTVELRQKDGTVSTWSVTAQREGGKTPCDRIAEVEAERDAARAALRQAATLMRTPSDHYESVDVFSGEEGPPCTCLRCEALRIEAPPTAPAE